MRPSGAVLLHREADGAAEEERGLEIDLVLDVPVLLGDRGEVGAAAEHAREVRDAPEAAELGARAPDELGVRGEIREVDGRGGVARAREPGEHLRERVAVLIDAEHAPPRRATASAVARPMPRAAPVTITPRPSSPAPTDQSPRTTATA